ncbi:MAG: sensor domain-containing protein [Peptostreptococcaceae bacterium]
MKRNSIYATSEYKKYTLDEIKELENIKLKYYTLLETIPYMAWFTDIEGNYQDINKEFIIHSDKEIKDIKGKGHKLVWERKVGNECELNDEEVLSKKQSMVFEEIVPGKRGYRRFDIYRSPVMDEEKNPIGIVAVGKDTTEIKNKDTQFRILIENIPFEVWQYDTNGVYIDVNRKYAKTRKTTREQLIGRNISELYDDEEVKKIIEENKKIIETKKSMKFTKKRFYDGEERIVEIYKTPILNIANEVIAIVGISVDVTEINKAKEEIKRQAYTDYHTGLLNKRALYEYMTTNLKNSAKVMMIMDVDNFKQINDSYGHHIGDIALLRIANKLKEINKNDYVFRFGGDEFIVISTDILDKEDIENKAKEIMREISNLEIENEKIKISLGVASCTCNPPKCIDNGCRLITMADIALYKAKEYGKNRYVLYTEKLEYERYFNLNLEKDLNEAIENKEVKLVYQPQYSKEGNLIGFEALFRWNNKKYEKIPIPKLINIMEKSDLIINIGNEIMRKACLFSNKINENRENKLVISFNVSSVQIMDDKFIDDVKSILEETKVDLSSIAIEITETVLLEDIKKGIQKIKELKELGIKIALDDFGTGYSSFNYLVKLPLSEVKIDKSFSIGMDENEEYINLIKLIVEASHSLNLGVVAEGVETIKQLNILKEIGVEYMQGYLFSKPLEENDAIKLLSKGAYDDKFKTPLKTE